MSIENFDLMLKTVYLVVL